MNNLVIVGASGHGKVIADIAEKVGYTDIVFLDDDPKVTSCGIHKVVGNCKSASSYKNADFIVAIGNAKIRRKTQSELSGMGLHIISLVHPSAVIAPDVKIGAGTVVMAGAVINPCTEIGQGCIINTCASVDHDCRIGDYVHVSVGAHVAGTVTVEENTWIGAGATISNNIEIVADCMIGAGAVVVCDIKKADTYIGVPARRMNP
jgi:sugar O-acyltransferase (sialic acid O-acetyltransferase NeuD family)